MTTFNDWNSLKKAIQQEMRNAMSETESKSYLDALHNNSDYYSEGEPLVMYKRTISLVIQCVLLMLWAVVMN